MNIGGKFPSNHLLLFHFHFFCSFLCLFKKICKSWIFFVIYVVSNFNALVVYKGNKTKLWAQKSMCFWNPYWKLGFSSALLTWNPYVHRSVVLWDFMMQFRVVKFLQYNTWNLILLECKVARAFGSHMYFCELHVQILNLMWLCVVLYMLASTFMDCNFNFYGLQIYPIHKSYPKWII
jgi:hypothetical protein